MAERASAAQASDKEGSVSESEGETLGEGQECQDRDCFESLPNRLTGLSPNIRYSSSQNPSPLLRHHPGEGMAAVTVPNALCPGHFKGEAGEDGSLWLKKFQVYVDLMGWDRATARKTFPPFVEGKASEWYEGLPDADKCTFASLIKAFSHRYLPHPATRWEKLESLAPGNRPRARQLTNFVNTCPGRGGTWRNRIGK
ncbi:hypothetical protein BaRGS_00001972 [Batillaria attramentaria]|uniref:Retrotransposon gag domain-containing protein n=1 Tax=Batillaria attramentaria TaxID=370345 RepID=A0ABD0M4N8_9CAEN